MICGSTWNVAPEEKQLFSSAITVWLVPAVTPEISPVVGLTVGPDGVKLYVIPAPTLVIVAMPSLVQVGSITEIIGVSGALGSVNVALTGTDSQPCWF